MGQHSCILLLKKVGFSLIAVLFFLSLTSCQRGIIEDTSTDPMDGIAPMILINNEYYVIESSTQNYEKTDLESLQFLGTIIQSVHHNEQPANNFETNYSYYVGYNVYKKTGDENMLFLSNKDSNELTPCTKMSVDS